MIEKKTHYSVTIVGGGMVGLFLAKALSQAGINVAVVESKKPPLAAEKNSLDSRVSAINAVSQRMLNNLGVWSSLCGNTYSPLHALKVWDSVGGGEIEFDSADAGEPALGAIVENREIVRVLWQSLQNDACVEWFCPAVPKVIEQTDQGLTLMLNDGKEIQSDLIVGADGACSWVREQMHVDRHERPYRQSAVVAVIQTEKPHQKTGWQAFSSDGVLALLPLANSHHCALVWSTDTQQADALVVMDADGFNREINNAFGRRLGELKILNPPKAIPLVMRHVKQYVKSGLALIGDAAHTLHPLAGQGVNLGFMDAACLAECIIDARAQHRAVGHLRVLRRYERWRKGDNTAMLIAMRGFKELFGTMSPWVIQARSVGMNTAHRFNGLKNCLMKVAMGESKDLPGLSTLSFL